MSVIDSLVISLSLDPKGMTDGQKKAVESLRRFETEAGRVGSRVEQSGDKAAAFFSNVRREALGMFAVFTAGRSLKAFFTDAVQTNAQLDYMARNLQLNVKTLSQLDAAAVQAGGSVGEIGNAFLNIRQKLADPQQRGNVANAFRFLGVDDYYDENTANVRADILKRVNRAIHANHMSNAISQSYLSSIGFGQGAINMAQGSEKEFDEREKRNAGTGLTEAQAEQARQLKEDFDALRNASSNLGGAMIEDLFPAVHKVSTELESLEKNHPEALERTFLGIAAAAGVAGTAISGLIAIRGLSALLGGAKNLSAIREAACGCEGGGGRGKGKAIEEAAENAAGAGRRGAASEAKRMGGRMSPYLAEGVDAAGGFGAGRALIRGSMMFGVPGLFGLAYEALRPEQANSNEEGALQNLQGAGRLGTTPLRPHYSDAERKQRETRALGILQTMGFSHNAALGIIGNMLQESGLDENARGDRGTAFGLGQWHADRANQIQRKFGIDVRNAGFLEQVRAYGLELQSGDDAGARQAGRELQGNVSLMQAVHAVRAHHERPANKFGNEDALRFAQATQVGRDIGAPASPTTIQTGDITIHTQATDAKGIAQDFHRELRKTLPTQSMNGLM